MTWQTPVTNRDAINKGYCNHDMLNRIEKNCSYLADQLNYFGYRVDITAKTDWAIDDFPYLIQINRIRDNINVLLDAYFKMPGSPDIRYWNSLNWKDANSLEQNLLNINTLLELMVQSFKYCGEFICGEEVM